VTGALLLGFLGVHLVAQHFIVPGGLRAYADVVAYLRHPFALAGEVGLLAAVIAHAALGVRASLVEILGPVGLRRASMALAIASLAAFGYGLWLTAVVLGG
jgi:succinate dehydrogenase hydrophobic anchor subunit